MGMMKHGWLLQYVGTGFFSLQKHQQKYTKRHPRSNNQHFQCGFLFGSTALPALTSTPPIQGPRPWAAPAFSARKNSLCLGNRVVKRCQWEVVYKYLLTNFIQTSWNLKSTPCFYHLDLLFWYGSWWFWSSNCKISRSRTRNQETEHESRHR